ncbi:MAG: PHP domain-containing protein, partial [Candidatus Omnitrophica bacterium]|nr:PHP domain-containing protein [Candidatus Omnitrophota bacterium]
AILDYNNEGRLETIDGIGKDLASKIEEFFSTGTIKIYDELKNEIPQGLLEMTEVPGLGPKTVRLLYEKLAIDSIDKLESAINQGRLDGIEGIKEKTRNNILKGIELRKKAGELKTIDLVFPIAEYFKTELSKLEEVLLVEIAGSLRREKATVKDIDLIVASSFPDKVMDGFVSVANVKEVLAKGKTKCSVLTNDNFQIDLRVVSKENFYSALLYFTGSKEFNVRLRQLAIKKNYKLNEYGLFPLSPLEKPADLNQWSRPIEGDDGLKPPSPQTVRGQSSLTGLTENSFAHLSSGFTFSSEEEIFKRLGLSYVAAVLREDRGEIEAALAGKLPELINRKDIKGDLHVHSTFSDGHSSISEIADQASSLGYSYLAVCDHSQSLKIAGGLDVSDLKKKVSEIKKVNDGFDGFKILFGTEVDINADGRLDYPDSVLKDFDIVVAAVHIGLKQSRTEMTRRIVSACKNKFVNIIAHPTGVMFGYREAYDIDFDEVLKAALDNNVALEINCNPHRFDCDDLHVLRAKRKGVKLSIATDAHHLKHLSFMPLGVSIAKRGWLEKEDVINCMESKDLFRWLKK